MADRDHRRYARLLLVTANRSGRIVERTFSATNRSGTGTGRNCWGIWGRKSRGGKVIRGEELMKTNKFGNHQRASHRGFAWTPGFLYGGGRNWRLPDN